MRWSCKWLHGAALLLVSTVVMADDPVPSSDLAREQLARVIAVLKLQPDAAGQSCLDALHEAHKTEDQVKILENKSSNPDLALAQDVLETDYENGKEICGADAGRVCAIPGQTAGLKEACSTLRQGGHGR